MNLKGKMIEAIYNANLTKRATLVVFYLINRGNKRMTCFPSVKTIAKECNMSTRTVQRALNDLEVAGFVERESRYHDQGGQRSNLYYLQISEKKSEEDMGGNIDFDSYKGDELVENEKRNEEQIEVENVEISHCDGILDKKVCEYVERNKKSLKSIFLKTLDDVKGRFFSYLSWGVRHLDTP